MKNNVGFQPPSVSFGMGSIPQNRTVRSADTVSIGERERKKAARSSSRPPGAGTKMGRGQSQRKSAPPVPERIGEQKLQQRRKQKPRTKPVQHSAQETSEPESAARHNGRGSGPSPAFPSHRLPCSHRDPHETASPNPDGGSQSGHAEGDSDTDLSESERLPVSPCSRVPPQLQLRPELIEAEDRPSCRAERNNHGSADFPDFLPPPFNSWSLGQLAVFYNTEDRGTPRPRPVGPLERYMERMLQLEWRQIRTVQEEGGTTAGSDAVSSCHSHCALLSGCACTICRIRYTACCTTSSPCCRYARQSRLRPAAERGCRGPASLPKRSHSESRVHSADRSSASRAQRFGSPTQTNRHLRRMQASGNIRHPVHGANAKPQATGDSSVGDLLGAREGRRRSGSEQRRGGVEGQQGAMEKKRSGSECRRGGAERRRVAQLREREITPDAVDAIMDNLPGCKNYPINKANRPKQVEFVT
ncbi:uncharacterized protein AB9W97_018282 isoform 2-T2 [Spinachia spinachia]